jgi:hypothetical protein
VAPARSLPPIGILRHGRKGNLLQPGFELYISGFPRSGNTFALKAFLLANPHTPVRSHRHIPTFVIHSIRRDMRGMVLIRNPVDAATSWAIFTRSPLKLALQYYQDYYSALLRELNRSSILQKELRVAQELYQILAPRPLFRPSRPRHGTRTTQSIRLRPAV